jgi:hypothetical protein
LFNIKLIIYFVIQSTLKMKSEKYLSDISEIKNLMTKSSRFISLSGLSGILAGIYSLIGAGLTYKTIYFDTETNGDYKNLIITTPTLLQLICIAGAVVLLSLFTAIFFSNRKAIKHHEKIWDVTARRLVINFMIPLITGGVFILFLIEKEMLSLVAPLTLIFYGLSCVNASKYTFGDVRYLGITMILLGLLSLWFLGYGLLFWALGFGICHILYGTIMYFKHDRK